MYLLTESRIELKLIELVTRKHVITQQCRVPGFKMSVFTKRLKILDILVR